MEVPEHTILQDVETRWNTTYLMLERLVQQRKAINLFSVEQGGIDTLSNAEWELADRAVTILKPFYSATLEICADDVCISVVIPIIAMLGGKLQTTATDQGFKQMKAALRNSMVRRFASVKSTSLYIAATLLDPRFKDLYLNAEETAAAKNEILNFLSPVMDADETHENENATASAASGISTDTEVDVVSGVEAVANDLWDEHNCPLSVAQESSEGDSQVIPEFEQQLRYSCGT